MIDIPTTTITYLAARYSRMEEMLAFATDIKPYGYDASGCLWIHGAHGVDDGGTSEWGRFAQEDMDNIFECVTRDNRGCLFLFTEDQEGENRPKRNSRLVEMGLGLAYGLGIIVIGPHETIFDYLETVIWFETKQDCLDALRRAAS